MSAPQFSYSTDQESYQGSFDSVEQAVSAGFSGDDIESIWIGENVPPACADHLDADLLLDHITCQDEYCTDWAEGTFRDLSKESTQDLTVELRAMFERWLDKWKAHPTFFNIENAKEWTREEAVASGLADPIEGEEVEE